MGFSDITAKGLKGTLKLLPHDYATKITRKIRKELEPFGHEKTAFTSNKGPIYVSGVRRSLGMSDKLNQFEPETIRWIDRFIKSGDVVWDIGANVGLYSCYISKIPDIRLTAFEPHAATYAQLVQNILANNNGNKEVHTLNLAIGDETKLSLMHLNSMEPGFTASTVVAEDGKAEIGYQSIMQYTGDDFAETFKQAPTHLKIDVDGAEEAVLKGCQGTLKHLETLLIEVEGEFLKTFEHYEKKYILKAGLNPVKISEPHSQRMKFYVRENKDISSL